METIRYPRVTIQFCTQCKWLLRAAYFAQELLSTFSTSLGEVSLLPATGGVFVIEIYHENSGLPPSGGPATITKKVLWDRKVNGGFPETKELKKLVRDVIDPGRDLGHVDGKKEAATGPITQEAQEEKRQQLNPRCVLKEGDNVVCEDCG